MPGGGAAATGSALLLGGAPLPFPLPFLANAVAGKTTTSALPRSSALAVMRLAVRLRTRGTFVGGVVPPDVVPPVVVPPVVVPPVVVPPVVVPPVVVPPVVVPPVVMPPVVVPPVVVPRRL